jgi:transcriptional regulator with XRE-family HTH domain
MIALQIRSGRRGLGLSQQAFAEAITAAAADDGEDLSLTRVAVSQWEGAYFEPALRYRRHVARVLDADPRVLFPNVGRNDAA